MKECTCNNPDCPYLDENTAKREEAAGYTYGYVQTIRAERDAAEAEAQQWRDSYAEYLPKLAEVCAERDALRAGVRALADGWHNDAQRACDGATHGGCPDCMGSEYAVALLDLLDGNQEPKP